LVCSWAAKWNTILQAVSEGAVERDACAMARVSWGTWMKWKEKGRGNKRVRPIVKPVAPFGDLVRALNQVLAERRTDVRRARLERAKMGDVNAIDRVLGEDEAMKTAIARSAEAQVRVKLLRLQLEQTQLAIEVERIKLERMRGGGADTTVDIGDAAMWAELQRKAFGSARQGVTDGPGHHPTDHGVASGELPPLSAPLDPR
jgi:hypothetical protein